MSCLKLTLKLVRALYEALTVQRSLDWERSGVGGDKQPAVIFMCCGDQADESLPPLFLIDGASGLQSRRTWI